MNKLSKETKSKSARTVNNKKRTNSLNKKAIIVSIFLTIIGVFTAIYLYQYTHASKLEKQLLEKQSVLEERTNELNSKAEQLNLTDQQKQELQKQVDELNKIKSDLERQLQAKKEQASKVAVVAPKQAQASPVAVTGNKLDWLRASGIPESQWQYVDYIVSRESSWNPNAVNKSSGATGLCQSLPASKMASAGGDYLTNPVTQLRWCDSYAKSRYGGWANSYNEWIRKHWW